MTAIVLIGVVTALAIFAILFKLAAPQPKKAEKTEKGEIIKQLLALSELENRTSKAKLPAPPATPQAEKSKATSKAPQPQATEETSECVGL